MLFSNPILDAYKTSDLFGKSIFILLILLSITTWIIFLQKIIFYRSAKREGFSLQNQFQKKRLNPLSLELLDMGHPYALLYKNLKFHTLELLNKNRSALKEAKVFLSTSDMEMINAYLKSTISAQAKTMSKNLFILSTIVSLAPFLGLLGTVWGILLTFSELQAGASVSANATVMGGLAMALGTTVLGLIVAIPALISYNYLKTSSSYFAEEMKDFSQQLLSSVELQYRQVDVNNG